MLAVLLSILTWATGAYDVYNRLPAWLHGLADFTVGLAVGWVWRWWHGPIF